MLWLARRVVWCLEMSDKKVVGRNVFVGVGAVCVVLSVALAFLVVSYALMLRDKDSVIASLNVQVGDKDAEIAGLQNQLAQKNATIDGLEAAKLVSVGLKAEENRTGQAYYVRVYGYVVNVGVNATDDAAIHVVLYQTGGVVANDTYVDLGSISGEAFVSVDAKVYYEGSRIVSTSMILEWS